MLRVWNKLYKMLGNKIKSKIGRGEGKININIRTKIIKQTQNLVKSY